MPQSWEQYIRSEDAKHEPSDDDFLANAELDAYGHLNWTVGNEDWIACFDAVLSPEGERIAWHVVVDCESGSFTDTTESGVARIDDEDAIRHLKGLPSTYADTCSEFYIHEDPEDEDNYHGPVEWEETSKNWSAHLDTLIREAKESR